jgi:hypothetical protein
VRAVLRVEHESFIIDANPACASAKLHLACPASSVPGAPQDKLAMECEVTFKLPMPM